MKLISATELINLAKARGVTFGAGDPKIHLAYLTKLGLVPMSLRRKVDGIVEGHYPVTTVSRLEEITALKSEGLTYSQIAAQLSPAISQSLSFLSPNTNASIFPYAFYPVATLVIGLLLGFILAKTNNPATFAAYPISGNVANKEITVSKESLDKDSQPLYLISIPETGKNLFKVTGLEIK